MTIKSKIVHLDFLRNRIREVKTVKRIVVLTYGKFELYTPEDVMLLESAKQCGHMLVVAIVDDQNGVLNYENKQLLVASNKDVDFVVASFADNISKIIDYLGPNVVVIKSTDKLTQEADIIIKKNNIQITKIPIKGYLNMEEMIEKLKPYNKNCGGYF